MAKKKKRTEADPCDICVDQNSKKCAKCETGQRKALEMHDVEMASRQVATAVLEDAVQMPYERNIYIQQAKFFLKRTAEDILEAGRTLLVIKEKEGYGNFIKIVEDDIGIPYRSAQRFMNAAIKAQQYPKLNFGHMAKVGHVYTLLEAPEEDLKALEKQGVIAGRDMDELSRMSVKEMREMIKKLKNETDKIIKEEVKTIEAEKKALLKENERLQVFNLDNKNPKWAVEYTEKIDKQFNEIDSTLRRFAFDPRLADHPELMARINGLHETIQSRFQMFQENWDAFLAEMD